MYTKPVCCLPLTGGAADHERGGGPQRPRQLVPQQRGLHQRNEHHLEQADQLNCSTSDGKGGRAVSNAGVLQQHLGALMQKKRRQHTTAQAAGRQATRLHRPGTSQCAQCPLMQFCAAAVHPPIEGSTSPGALIWPTKPHANAVVRAASARLRYRRGCRCSNRSNRADMPRSRGSVGRTVLFSRVGGGRWGPDPPPASSSAAVAAACHCCSGTA